MIPMTTQTKLAMIAVTMIIVLTVLLVAVSHAYLGARDALTAEKQISSRQQAEVSACTAQLTQQNQTIIAEAARAKARIAGLNDELLKLKEESRDKSDEVNSYEPSEPVSQVCTQNEADDYHKTQALLRSYQSGVLK